MEGGLIGRGWIAVALSQAVQQGMRGFMRHYVMREARENRVSIRAREIAEEQRPVAFGIEGIRLGKRMWRDFQLMAVKAPAHSTSQREFKARQRAHHDRINVLRMELRIGYQPPVG